MNINKITSVVKNVRSERLEKLDKIIELGIDPYPSKLNFDRSDISTALVSLGKNISVAGRILASRGHGNVVFMDLTDESGKMQLFFQKKVLGDLFKILKLIDMGDFIAVNGKVIKTVAGEISVDVEDFQILVKSLKQLPSQWYGLKDVEDRYRKRYLDIILNSEVKKRLTMRSKIIDSVRDFLTDRGFIEVETPTLQPIYGGGFARPFSTHHNKLDTDFYLRISDEMYLKRLIVGGFEKVFEITKVFRNEGIDFDHNPEFTMFEAQIAYEDYTYGMDLIESIFEYTSEKVLGKTKFDYQGTEIEVKKTWTRYKLVESVKEFTGVDPLEWKTLEEAKKAILKIGIKDEKEKELKNIQTIGECMAFAFEEFVEERLIQPTIIYDYPVEVSPLAKKCEDPRFTQRFEFFAFGSELGNNYTELNDPQDLTKRFVEEKKREKAGFDEAHQTDYDYLEAIEHGFPPTCGISIGIDRFVMLLTNARSIKEVIPFPTLKPKINEVTTRSGKLANAKNKSKYFDYSISEEVKESYEDVSFAYTIIHGVDIKREDRLLEERKSDVLKSRSKLTTEAINEIGSIESYREMIKKTGVDYHSRRPSPDALLRRISQGKGLYTINTAVDAYNLAVIETGIGLGGFDLSKIKEPVTLRYSDEGEEILLLGDEEKTFTKKGELVYADSEKVLTIDLNYRDINETKITTNTKDIILIADGGPKINTIDIENALELGANNIIEFCGGKMDKIKLVK